MNIVSMGTINASLVTGREVFKSAILSNASYVILLHNHPSGDPTPSKDDIILTKRIIETGNLIGIPLVDHIIIGDNRYVSFRESGYMDKPV